MKGVRIVLDWDGTLTKRDTLHVVARIGYKRNRHRDLTPWDQIVRAYMSDYAEHRDSYRPAKLERREIAQESAWLASLEGVELRSVKRVQDAGIFADVTERGIRTAAEDAVRSNEIQLRDGWKDVLSIAARSGDEGAEENPAPISIVSVNWSAAFIRACLSAALAASPPVKPPADSIPILSNHLPCESSVGGGPEPASIRTSADKLRVFQNLRAGGDGPAFYVGDSPTDFDCLVAADVGVCVRDEPMGSGQTELKESLERVGVEVLRLDLNTWTKRRRDRVGEGRDPGEADKLVVWWVTDLSEVASFVEKFSYLD